MKLTVLILSLSMITLEANCQDFSVKLSTIEKITNGINTSLRSYKTLKLENAEVFEQTTDGGAELIGYFKGNQVKKIELFVGLSYGINEFEFFYENAELIYVKEIFRQFIWNEDKGRFDYSKTEDTFRGDYIFKDDFDYITLGHNRFEDDELDPELTLREESQQYRKKLESKL